MASSTLLSSDGCIKQWRQTAPGIKLSMFSLHSQDGAAMLLGVSDVVGEGKGCYMEREAATVIERGRERGGRRRLTKWFFLYNQ